MKPTALQVAERFGCAESQVKNQFRKNAAKIRDMVLRLKNGEHVTSYDISDIPSLENSASDYELKSTGEMKTLVTIP